MFFNLTDAQTLSSWASMRPRLAAQFTTTHTMHNITKQDQVTIAAARLASRIKAVDQAAEVLLTAAQQTKGELRDVYTTTETIRQVWAAYNILGDADCKTRGAAELLEYSTHT